MLSCMEQSLCQRRTRRGGREQARLAEAQTTRGARGSVRTSPPSPRQQSGSRRLAELVVLVQPALFTREPDRSDTIVGKSTTVSAMSGRSSGRLTRPTTLDRGSLGLSRCPRRVRTDRLAGASTTHALNPLESKANSNVRGQRRLSIAEAGRGSAANTASGTMRVHVERTPVPLDLRRNRLLGARVQLA